MKLKPGFLLIELMIACILLSFTMLVCARFFVVTINQYVQARGRLMAMHVAQNSVEKLLHHQPLESGVRIHTMKLDLPQGAADLQVPSSVLQYVQVTSKTGKPLILAGAIHAE